MKSSRLGFTLIELLVVIAIIAVLSVVVVLSLNPAELLRQSRDTNRLSDMDTLNHALSVYSVDQSGMPSFFMGSSSVVYVSLPDSSSTCGNLNLPILPTGYTYNCATSATLKNTNGSGWIPVPLANTSGGSPVGNLPIDPTNQSSSRFYYTYTTNGTQYELTSVMESAKYKLGGTNDVVSGDGGVLATAYEKGSQLGLEPLDYGDSSLKGLWTFQEGSGTVIYDYSGNNASGSWTGGASYAPGKIGPYAGNFNGSNYVKITNSVATLSSVVSGPNNFTVVAWVNPTTCTISSNANSIFDKFSADGFRFLLGPSTSCSLNTSTRVPGPLTGNSGPAVATSTWSFVGVTFTSGGAVTFYLNGVPSSGGTNATTWTATNIAPFIGYASNNNDYFRGLIDDVRVYSRVLSTSEIAAMYNSGK